MNAGFKAVFTVVVLLVAYGLLVQAFHLMNLPSDKTLVGGIAIILFVVVAMSIILRLMWSKAK